MVTNNDPRKRKQQRIEQLAQMSKDPEKLAEELEAMSEILYTMEQDQQDDEIKILTGMMADLSAILSIQYFKQARTTQDEESPDDKKG